MIVFGLLSSVSGILTFSPSAGDSTPAPPCPAAAGSSNRPAPDSPSCFVLRASRPLLPKPPRPCCCHPSPSPPSRSPCPTARWPATRPHRRPGPDLRRPRRAHRVLRHRQRGAKHRFPLTTRSTNPAPAVASDELIAQHTTRPEEQAPALPLQQPRPNQTLICWRLGERLIGPGQGILRGPVRQSGLHAVSARLADPPGGCPVGGGESDELRPPVIGVWGAFGVAGLGQPLHLPGDVRGFHLQPGC